MLRAKQVYKILDNKVQQLAKELEKATELYSKTNLIGRGTEKYLEEIVRLRHEIITYDKVLILIENEERNKDIEDWK